MKAIFQDALGEPTDVLKVVDIADAAEPGAGNVLVDITLAPVHHGDLALIRTQFPAGSDPVPRGSEGVGIVRALGADVEGQGKIAVGDRVIVFPTSGSWAESIVVPAFAVTPVPAELSDEVAGQLLINFATARMILRGLRKSVSDDALRDGAVLVTGASTVVARLLIHLLGEEGLTAIGLARDTASAERVSRELKGVPIAATADADWQARVTSFASDKKIVGVLDCVSGPLLADVAKLLADDAVIVTYGALGGINFGISAVELVGHQFVIRGIVFTRWFTDLTPEEQVGDIQAAFATASALPSVFKTAGVYGLDEIHDAVAAVEAPGRDGFVFLRP